MPTGHHSAADARRHFAVALLIVWGGCVAYLTLRPLGWQTPVPFWAFFTTTMAGVDMAQNIVLFLPIGWIGRRAGWSLLVTALVAFCCSDAVEFAQQWVSGRTSTAFDITFNTLGALLGWSLASPTTSAWRRVALSFAALAAGLWLHAWNSGWPSHVIRAAGNGAAAKVTTVACPAGAPQTTLCIALPGGADTGDVYVRVVGPDERTYARVQRVSAGSDAAGGGCVRLRFESTRGAPLHLRMPLTVACELPSAPGAPTTVLVDPRLEQDAGSDWTLRRASVWLWPLWPFESYAPPVLRAAGALAFVVLAALCAGAAPWWLPVGYLLALSGLAWAAPMRMPALWDLGWTLLAWVVAVGAVRVDTWWRGETGTAAPADGAGSRSM